MDASAPGERAREVYGEKTSPFRRAPRQPLLHRISPVSAELPGYRRPAFRRDLLAGLTVAALAVPSGMAYAELAGLLPVAGLYALLLPVVLYVVLGSSRQLVIGPEGAIAALVAAAVVPLAAGDADRYADLAAVLALLVGVLYLVAAIARLGWVADYLSRPVLVGYLHGIAVVLVIAQLGPLTGVDIGAADPVPRLVEFGRELGGASALTIAVGAACTAGLLLLGRFAPRLPAALLVIVAAIAASALLDLAAHGVAVIGTIPAGLPALALPAVRPEDMLALLPAALGIFLVGFADQILTARSFAGRHGQHVRAGQELLAMGAANLAAGGTQSFPLGASGSRTAVNDRAGARTQIAGLVAASATALVLLALTAPLGHLPRAALAAVIVVAAIGLVDPAAWRQLARTNRAELSIAAGTAAGVVLLGVLRALAVAVVLSVLDVVRRSARPHDAVLGWVERLGRYADLSLHPSATVTPGVVVYRLDDRLFFANARYVTGRVREAIAGAPGRVRCLVFDAEALTDLDATGAGALMELIEDLARDGISFLFARLSGRMAQVLRDAGVLAEGEAGAVHPTVRAAVLAAMEGRAS